MNTLPVRMKDTPRYVLFLELKDFFLSRPKDTIRTRKDNITMMKNCFIDREHRAIADLVDGVEIGLRGMCITRINVPKEHRGKGVATRLLNEILNEADRTNTTLWLEIVPSDGLNYVQLEAWYKRHGFYLSSYNFFKRRPQSLTIESNKHVDCDCMSCRPFTY